MDRESAINALALSDVRYGPAPRGFALQPPTPPPPQTKTRLGPQRVRMSSGERPIGAAKGKQSHTEALCQPPPPKECLAGPPL